MLSYAFAILMGTAAVFAAFWGAGLESKARKQYYEQHFAAKLELYLPGENPILYRLSRTSYILGRRPRKCDIQINHNSVSRIHALITRANNAYYIQPAYNEDARKWGVVYINGQRLPNSPCQLRSGDHIHLGEVSITYEEEQKNERKP